VATLHLVAAAPFWDDAALPFRVFGGGTVCRVVPDKGFRKAALAASDDERLLIVDCPDADGWLVPQGVVAEWMARNLRNAELEDVMLGHALYEHLTKTDERGHSRSGASPLVHWAPGFPTSASLRPPEFLPDDDEAPAVNRERVPYARAVADLLSSLDSRFHLRDVEVGFLFQAGAGGITPRPFR
jgi:hypothetical protein